MKCQDVEKYLQAYIDGEFSGMEESEIEQHFKFCPVCQKRVSFQTWLKKGVKQSIPSVKAPRRLHAEINHMLKKERRRATPTYIKLAPAFAILLVFLGAFFMPRIQISEPIVSATIDKHMKKLPLDVQSDNQTEVKRYLQEKTAFPVRIPRFTSRTVRLIGGRVTSIENRVAIYMAYDSGGRRYSMMVRPSVESENALNLPNSILRTINKRRFAVLKRNGFNVVLWHANQMLYSFVSDEGDEDSLVELAANIEYDAPDTISASATPPLEREF